MGRGLTLTAKLAIVTTIELVLLFFAVGSYQVSLTRQSYEEAHAYSSSLCAQTADVLEAKLKRIRQAAQTIAYFKNTGEYLQSNSVSQMLEIQPAISSMSQYIIESNEDIVDIILADMDRNLLSYNGLMDSSTLNNLAKVYPGLLSDDKLKPLFTPIMNMKEAGGVYYTYIMPIYSTESYERIGTCVVLCNGRSLLSLLQDMAPPGNNYIINLKYQANNRDMAVVNSTNIPVQPTYFINAIGDLGLYMQSTLDITALPNSNAALRGMLFLFAAIMVCMLSLTVLILYFGFTKPLRQLIRRINRIGRGKHTRLEPIKTAELGSIVETINTMLEELETNTAARMEGQTKLYAAELNTQQARFYALQSQINPHFLYNTLECMRSMGLVYEAPEVVDISVALSAIFRYSIKGSNIVRVREEMDIISQYLKIISIRFGDRFAFHWQVPEELRDLYILKMILQPLVENAVYHGLEPKEGPGMLSISGHIWEGQLLFEVADDGAGMEPAEVEGLHAMLSADPGAIPAGNHRSVGLENIHQRIRLFFGDRYGLTITSEKDRGTTVTVKLPIRTSMEL